METGIANVLPIFKKGDVNDVINYRPISLLSLVEKVVERVVYNKFYPFVENRIYHLQHGFMKGRSTVTQLLAIVHQLSKSIDERGQTDIAYLDFTKAFDSVSHNLIIDKLYSIGIRGPLLKWFRSYLHDRKQRVVLDGKCSEWLSVTSGVPQGSILGPAVFVLFINDMPDVVSEPSTLALFADDAKCLRAINDVGDCVALQDDLNNLSEWSVKWKLNFNIEKCTISTITRKRNPVLSSYTIAHCPIKRVNEQRDLGIHISSNATFNEHIYTQICKANKMLGLIQRTVSRDKRLLPTRSLYIMLVRSHLEYASEVWSPKSVTLIKLIERVQRRATHILMPELEYKERLRRLDLLPLLHRREIKDLTTFYKLKSGLYNCDIDSYVAFCSDTRLRSTAQGKLKTPRCRTELFKASFFNRIVYLWNNLPENVRTFSGSVGKFKYYCREFYKTIPYDPDRPCASWVS